MNNFSIQCKKILTESKVTRYIDTISGERLFVRDEHLDLFKKYYKDPECMILHRIDGPAVENTIAINGIKYYINGKQYKYNEWLLMRELKDKKYIDDAVRILDI